MTSMKKPILLLGAISCLTLGHTQTVNFTFTGEMDSLLVPNCVDSIIVNIWGAEGSASTVGGAPGKGAYMNVKMDVTPGQWVYVNVGGQNGYNGGGMGGYGTPGSGGLAGNAGGGGGASDIRIGGKTLDDRMIVAAGGGGGGRNYVNGSCAPCGVGGDGGHGGITTGNDGVDAINGGYGANPGGAGKGGTQLAGGDGGDGTEGGLGNPGTLGQGGVGIDGSFSVAGGGGGGGYYGGGSGGNANAGSGVAGSGGGGGSSYYDASATLVNGLPGIRSGNGQISITYVISAPIMTYAVGQSDITLTALQSGVSYQWLNCGTGYSVVPGATNQAFTANANGTYAVELDNNNGCVDTSACFTISEVGVSENEPLQVEVYPNPAHENVTVSLGVEAANILVEIYDLGGRVVLQTLETQSTFIVNTDALQNGVYLLQIKADAFPVSRIQLVKN